MIYIAREENCRALYTNACITPYLCTVIIVFVLYKKIQATWSKSGKLHAAELRSDIVWKDAVWRVGCYHLRAGEKTDLRGEVFVGK